MTSLVTYALFLVLVLAYGSVAVGAIVRAIPTIAV